MKSDIPLGTKRYSVTTWQDWQKYFHFIVIAYRRDKFKRSGRIGWRKLGFEAPSGEINQARYIDRRDAINAGKASVAKIKAESKK